MNALFREGSKSCGESGRPGLYMDAVVPLDKGADWYPFSTVDK